MPNQHLARVDGRVFRLGDRVLQDRYPESDALQARVIRHCECCNVVELYDVNLVEEGQPVFEPACSLTTDEEWKVWNDPDWPANDGFNEFLSANPHSFGRGLA